MALEYYSVGTPSLGVLGQEFRGTAWGRFQDSQRVDGVLDKGNIRNNESLCGVQSIEKQREGNARI